MKDKDFFKIGDILKTALQTTNSEACAIYCTATSGCNVSVFDGTTCYPKMVATTATPKTRMGYDVIVPDGSTYLGCTQSPARFMFT